MPHRCLGIPEVLLIVAQELRAQSLPSVLNLALTNSAICEPCLDVLWEEQTTLIPFLRLFPEYELLVQPDRFPGVTSKPEEIHEVHLTGPPSRDSWLKAQRYARRVRSMTFEKYDGGTYGRYQQRPSGNNRAEEVENEDQEQAEEQAEEDDESDADEPIVLREAVDIDQQSLKLLLQCAEGEPLFPYLRILNCTEPSSMEPSFFLDLPNLFVPSLRELLLALGQNDVDEDVAMIRALPAACPDLTMLLINCGGPLSEETSEALREAILQWGSLNAVRLPDTRASTLAHLGQCEAFESVDLAVREHILLDGNPEPVAFGATVDWFAIEAHNPTFVERALRMISGARLKAKAFDVLFDDDAEAGGYDVRLRNLALLATMLEPSMVQQVLYYQDTDIDPTWGPLPSSSLVQFTSYPNLTHLGLDCWIDYTDEDLATVAKGLPLLELFVLDVHAQEREDLERQDRATLAGLIPFSHYCRKLERLCLRLDATHIPEIPDTPEATASIKHAVRTHFADSEVEDPAAVAAFLARIFPAGCTIARYPPSHGIYSSYVDTFDDDEAWDKERVGNWPIGLWSEVYDELIELQEST
ncbi:uncharacterized protein SCHCODRAFT_02531494 [Schizophyllum commune H4-8]|uniref:F-box domain-containing protein n=1 Tax=Schizophyllum commune (strain H4-8 / FGSC 9210) TaxID=578458 RepID=D8PYL0_SCHCM|nr:uncharacterized protein SCHCODRAFT_02531494 [Schizophyllum commune H4-8]KAI5896011.1 hypothetical protein SCHCODRAFT_02531494 [Schizophyllum commune H4-8]